MNGFELDKEYPTLNFESDEDAVKISLFYFLELVMIMGWGTLGNLKETQNGKVVYHEKKPMNKKFLESYSLYGFSFAFKAYEIVSSINGWVVNRALHDAIRRIMQWSCTYSHLHQLQLFVPPDEDNLTFDRDTCGSLTYTKPKLDQRVGIQVRPLLERPEASADCMGFRLDNIKLDRMDSILDHMESFFTTELSTIKELLMFLVKSPRATSRDTNNRNNHEEEGDGDGNVHKDHDVDMDGTHQAGKDHEFVDDARVEEDAFKDGSMHIPVYGIGHIIYG
uniref:Uncharacterized protein n=1 Tax=Cucumis sativus TaxID=3659 RepID=A0A0A0LYA9_CUCSA